MNCDVPGEDDLLASSRTVLQWWYSVRLQKAGQACLLLLTATFVTSMPVIAQHLVMLPEHPALPRFSDVVFSPRFLRPESVEVGKGYGVTRAEWIYVSKWDEAAKELKQLAPWVGLTLNANPHLPEGKGYAMDFDDVPLVAPWMKSWGAKYVTTTNPETRLALSKWLDSSIAVGARSIQVDDPLLQVYSARFHAGDFNPATQAGFGPWLKTYPDQAQVRAAGLEGYAGNYRDYLIERYQVKDAADYRRRFQSFSSNALWQAYVQDTLADHFKALRKTLRGASPSSLALSMNVAIRWPDARFHSFFLTAFPDYLMAETEIADSASMIAQVATARALGLGFVPSIRPIDVARNRTAIAMFYALGAQPIVPWDVFVPDQPRYFGTVAEYGDIYRFVRSYPQLLDGHVALATVAIVVDPSRFSLSVVQALTQKLTERQIPYAFVMLSDANGERPLTLEHLAGFKLLALGLKESEMRVADRTLLAALNTPKADTDAVTIVTLDALRPFVIAPSDGNMKVFARAGMDEKRPDWVVHVIDEARGGVQLAEADLTCRRRIGLRTSELGMPQTLAASWIVGESSQSVLVDQGADGHSYFTLPGCPVWGMLHLTAGATKSPSH